jgi:GT2 family glycosyltransferase
VLLPVSVIIPAYNRAEMLRRALASVCAQRPSPPAEVIVVDDGSEDDTAEVALRLGARVVTHERNLGLSAGRNSGLRAARHAWVALLDSDDEWLPHHLETTWAMRGDHVLVAGSALRCGADPRAYRFAGPVTRKPVVLRSADELVYPGNIIPVSSSLFRRDLALEVGGFRPYNGVVEDFDMWLRLLDRGTAICSPRVTVIYHVHAGQMSLADLQAMQLGHAAAAEAHRRRTRGSRVPLERAAAVAAWDNLRTALDAGDRRRAWQMGAFIAARPQRILGVIRLWPTRFRIRRRSAALRRAGLGPVTSSPGPS